ncbi:hypothetical protein U2F26_02055 [Micromonospora sp. 4G57]|uniref:Uncharacterized protein n=1 Tax=Micromonospora sicca TaxID=2202420 RepID=A0ABU5JBF4_9ACTN|nr:MULTISPECIES: hypothetical protein [unclassified Micromonospora]MDZ5441519.1 hypothetical protein [Micromonospora sp. 4G57]MDZ5489916.1 hypothetical protein [Micromonospora sp. 4G53]
MGSDWTWELRVPVLRPVNKVIYEVLALAAGFGLKFRRPDGCINLFDNDGELRIVEDQDEAVAAMAAGKASSQLWTPDGVDLHLSCRPDQSSTAINLSWSLDAAWTFRRPNSDADGYRQLHARLTALWLQAADALAAGIGRVMDEWSLDQIWHLTRIHEEDHPVDGWPALLGWWTYLGAEVSRMLPAPPLPEISAHSRLLPSGARVVALLDDPAAVDAARYEALHTRWLKHLPS